MSLLELSETDFDPADIHDAARSGPEVVGRWVALRPAWMRRAACRGQGTDSYFPHLGYDSRAAKAVCESCPVLPACMRYALDDPDLVGVWGGCTETERREIRKRAG